jgi:hypothetical protein
MANEISVNLSCAISQGGNNVSSNATYQQNARNGGFIGNEQTIGTSQESLILGDVGTTPVLVMIKNLDATNFVQVDADTAFDKFPQKILPGKAIYLAPETGTIYIKADTAPVVVWVVAA